MSNQNNTKINGEPTTNGTTNPDGSKKAGEKIPNNEGKKGTLNDEETNNLEHTKETKSGTLLDVGDTVIRGLGQYVKPIENFYSRWTNLWNKLDVETRNKWADTFDASVYNLGRIAVGAFLNGICKDELLQQPQVLDILYKQIETMVTTTNTVRYRNTAPRSVEDQTKILTTIFGTLAVEYDGIVSSLSQHRSNRRIPFYGIYSGEIQGIKFIDESGAFTQPNALIYSRVGFTSQPSSDAYETSVWSATSDVTTVYEKLNQYHKNELADEFHRRNMKWDSSRLLGTSFIPKQDQYSSNWSFCDVLTKLLLYKVSAYPTLLDPHVPGSNYVITQIDGIQRPDRITITNENRCCPVAADLFSGSTQAICMTMEQMTRVVNGYSQDKLPLEWTSDHWDETVAVVPIKSGDLDIVHEIGGKLWFWAVAHAYYPWCGFQADRDNVDVKRIERDSSHWPQTHDEDDKTYWDPKAYRTLIEGPTTKFLFVVVDPSGGTSLKVRGANGIISFLDVWNGSDNVDPHDVTTFFNEDIASDDFSGIDMAIDRWKSMYGNTMDVAKAYDCVQQNITYTTPSNVTINNYDANYNSNLRKWNSVDCGNHGVVAAERSYCNYGSEGFGDNEKADLWWKWNSWAVNPNGAILNCGKKSGTSNEVYDHGVHNYIPKSTWMIKIAVAAQMYDTNFPLNDNELDTTQIVNRLYHCSIMQHYKSNSLFQTFGLDVWSSMLPWRMNTITGSNSPSAHNSINHVWNAYGISDIYVNWPSVLANWKEDYFGIDINNLGWTREQKAQFWSTIVPVFVNSQNFRTSNSKDIVTTRDTNFEDSVESMNINQFRTAIKTKKKNDGVLTRQQMKWYQTAENIRANSINNYTTNGNTLVSETPDGIAIASNCSYGFGNYYWAYLFENNSNINTDVLIPSYTAIPRIISTDWYQKNKRPSYYLSKVQRLNWLQNNTYKYYLPKYHIDGSTYDDLADEMGFTDSVTPLSLE